MWAYRSSRPVQVPNRFSGHHVGGIRQARWNEVEPHPTDMPILSDAGVAAYPRGLIDEQLAWAGIVMSSLLTGEAFGAVAGGGTAAGS
jgi:8-oxo-dGTP diphosphatase